MTASRASIAMALQQFGPYELYMLALSVASLAVIAADLTLPLNPATKQVLGYADAFVCGLFFLDFIRSLVRARSRAQYMLRSGWLDLISSVPSVGVLRFGRIGRIVRIIRVLRAVRSARTVGHVILARRRESALLASALVTILATVVASLTILQLEDTPDANIRTGGDALWWAFTTIAAVGYGERYPVTAEGRVIAAMLMVIGVALLGTLSGVAASWFLNPDVAASEGRLENLEQKVEELRAEISDQ